MNGNREPAAPRIFFDGAFSEPRLDHPECVTVGPDGHLWCGGEGGQIYRIAPDASSIDKVADTGGFCLGLTFGPDGRLYVCDQMHGAVLCVDVRDGTVEHFASRADGRTLRIPNFATFDGNGQLYVSDSHGFKDPGPGIYRFAPAGSGCLWYRGPLDFANGLAWNPAGTRLYVAETFAHRVIRIPRNGDGSAGASEIVAELPGVLPDGLLFTGGRLYVACYEPSQIMAIGPDGKASIVYHDPEAHLLCHPTNLTVLGDQLIAANLGRWHLTAIPLSIAGPA